MLYIRGQTSKHHVLMTAEITKITFHTMAVNNATMLTSEYNFNLNLLQVLCCLMLKCPKRCTVWVTYYCK